MASTFDISPERRASSLHYYYRQLIVTPPPVTKRDADLTGKTAIITGANGGIGLEVARQLLDLGAKVIITTRSVSKGEAARQELSKGRDLPSQDAIQVWPLDLSSYDSILAFVERAKILDNLDIAVLNAGVFKLAETFDPATGYEEAVQVNYLSTILLTILLLPIMKAKNSRNSTPILPAFKEKVQHWDFAENYRTSKLLGQLFLTELAKRVDPSDVVLDWANPGFCTSDLGRETSGLIRFLFRIQKTVLAWPCEKGARTLVHAVTTLGRDAHGQFVEDAKIQPGPVLIYKPEGSRLAKQLYEDTLAELEFAAVRGIVDELVRSK
ncbi:hypothetical protein GE09DRAFT_1249901 [Coniochaeta sp. 2T2.1]|nr:hypothetical protein GE09DRAFT_1249901 [Coniochaeta sp. 2T2.1]